MTEAFQPPQWYVVQTLSNKENSVKKYIDKFSQIDAAGKFVHEVLVPAEKVTEIKSGKKRSRVRKFYPGYVFVHMVLYDKNGKLLQEPWIFVRGADGVIDFVGKDRPSPLKQDEIERIINQVSQSAGKENLKVIYELGDVVKITDGPFINLTGQVESIDEERGKLKLGMSIFGRYTPVELEFWQVERVVE